jgi:uncharacterized protein (TIGR03032 family)
VSNAIPLPFGGAAGIAVADGRLAIATSTAVHDHRSHKAVPMDLGLPPGCDAFYLPRNVHSTGNIGVREIAFTGDGELWMVSSRFSSLVTVDQQHSFVPRWRPPFVTGLVPEDRCHLNGVGLVNGRIGFVTALGATDRLSGWRDNKLDGGVLIDVASGEPAATGLCMPHSPRWHDGKLWVLESGKGLLLMVDPDTGRTETVASMPGFTRGLAFAGQYAFVGLSRIRETVFRGLPILERGELWSGCWVIDLNTGRTVAEAPFPSSGQELFDVQVLAEQQFPVIATANSDFAANAFVIPGD